MQPEAQHTKAANHRQGSEEDHLLRILLHGGKNAIHRRLVHAGHKATGEELGEVVQHPAGNGGVVHHQQVAAGDGQPAMPMPLVPRLFQRLVGLHNALAAGAANGKLHRQHGHAQHQQEHQIQQHKYAAAVLASHIRKAPHIANTDGAARAHQQEAQARVK